jgi:hypothetical protein
MQLPLNSTGKIPGPVTKVVLVRMPETSPFGLNLFERDDMSTFISKRLKAAAAVLVVGLFPVLMKAVETGTGIDIPGAWEADLQHWFVALLAGIGVNYTNNVTASTETKTSTTKTAQ